MPVALEYYSDHLLLRLVGTAALSSLRRTIIIPYSDVREVAVEPPTWPPLLQNRLGLYVPKVKVSGTFMSWTFDERRFLHFDRNSRHVLVLRLAGHPNFEEVAVDVRDPEAARNEIEERRKR